MKSRQLANVLLKLFGFTTIIRGIPQLFYSAMLLITRTGVSADQTRADMFATLVSSLITTILGIFIIAKSRAIAAWMFKNEEE